jgi:DNA-binding IclR family transcriptional regulator
LEDKALWPVIYGRPLPAFTSNSITDPDRLREELDHVRKQGFAVDREEIEEGLMCVAAPIIDAEGNTCAAISMAGPSSRIISRLDDHIAAVRITSHNLSSELGSNVRRLREMNSVASSLEF